MRLICLLIEQLMRAINAFLCTRALNRFNLSINLIFFNTGSNYNKKAQNVSLIIGVRINATPTINNWDAIYYS